MRWRPLPPALLRTRAAVRPAGRAALGALLAVLVSAVPACSGGDQPAAPTPAPAPELPNTPPDNMTMEVWFTGGRDALTAVRDQVRAEALRNDYVRRLAAHREALSALARRAGWTFTVHHTDKPPQAALLPLYIDLAGQVS